MNELCEKIDLTEVAYFGNTQSKVAGLFCQFRVIFVFDLYVS